MEEKYKRFVNYKVILCFFSSFISCHCFLIEPDNAVKPNGTGPQCLAINEFLSEKKVLKHQIDEVGQEIYQLKHDNDQTLAILSEQLKHKLSIMDDKLSEKSKQNDSARMLDLEMKYTMMTENCSKVQEYYRDLHRQHNTEVRRLNNLTLALEKKVSALENLNSVNQTMNLLSLNTQIHSLQQTASLLKNNQNARNQDFLALYNITLASDKNIKQLQKDFLDDLHMLAVDQNQTFDDVNSRLMHLFKDISDTKNQLHSIETNQNVTIINVYSEIGNIKDLIMENSRKVALTAFSTGGSFSDSIAKFPYILSSTGINDINSFKTTGKFVCEFPGLYFISSYLRSSMDGGGYYLKKNGRSISYSAFTDWPSSAGRATSDISAAVDCQKNDELYLQLDSGYSIESTWSLLTIIKIK